jgi:beta-lactam-binding protein with PASTA domain
METTNLNTPNTPKTISKSELTTMVNNGAKKETIATYYGLNVAQTTKLLKDCNLTIRKFHKPSYMIVD